VLTLALALLVFGTAPAHAGRAAELSSAARAALNRLYKTNPTTKALGSKATAILVFPKIVKAGFLVGAQGGDGAMIRGGKVVGYYRSLAGSYGFQAGMQWFGYALFFMNQSSLDQLTKTGGWEIGTGPSLVVVDEGFARSFTTNTLTSDVYAVTFAQQGLMGGVGIQGSKITRIHPK
jgi:lipid-binding SYLF domain-containing protein